MVSCCLLRLFFLEVNRPICSLKLKPIEIALESWGIPMETHGVVGTTPHQPKPSIK